MKLVNTVASISLSSPLFPWIQAEPSRKMVCGAFFSLNRVSGDINFA